MIIWRLLSINNTVEGSNPIKDVLVSDVLPTGIEFTDGKIYLNGEVVLTVDENTFEYVLSEVAYGADYVFTFEVVATNDAIGNPVNIATVVDPTDPEVPVTPEVPVEVKPEAKLDADKTVSKDSVVVGEEFTYTISVKNTVEGSNPIKDVLVSDVLPKGIEFSDGKIYLNGEVVLTVDGNTFEYTLSEVVYGEDYVFTFIVVATNDAIGNPVNIATVVDPTDPENPITPEVPVEVIEKVTVPIEEEVLGAESDDSLEQDNQVNTGIYDYSIIYLGTLLVSVFLFIVLYSRRRKLKV